MAKTEEQATQHGLLCVWGRFAQEIRLISGIKAIPLTQTIYGADLVSRSKEPAPGVRFLRSFSPSLATGVPLSIER